MAVRAWLKEHLQTARSRPGHAALEATYAVYLGLWHSVTSRWPVGTNVFERDWDALVILDACRLDAMQAVAPEYDFLGDIEAIWSRGSHSHEWIARTFTVEHRDAIRETAYVNSNGFADLTLDEGVYPTPRYEMPVDLSRNDVVTADEFYLLDNAKNKLDEERYERYGTIPPRYMTDRAIHVGREHNPEWLIVHYFQPHQPFVGRAIRDDRDPTENERSTYARARAGHVTDDELWELYLDNLRSVLDEVELLRENLTFGSLAITADHGEWIGEFGQYGHPEGHVFPSVRKVPWTSTTARDKHTHEPAPENLHEVGRQTDGNVEQRLADLGYRV